jgi:hypothetical protein
MQWKFIEYPWQAVFWDDAPQTDMHEGVRPNNGAGFVLPLSRALEMGLSYSVPVRLIDALSRRAYVELPGPSYRKEGLQDLPLLHPDAALGDVILRYRDSTNRTDNEIAIAFHEHVTRLLQVAAEYVHRERKVRRNRFLEFQFAETVEKLVAHTDPDVAARALICDLAEDTPAHLEEIVSRPRKLLRRAQSLVRMDRLQEMDSACLIDYARRPGRTAAIKSGERQRLTGVVREETVDTLENRVVRDFCERVKRTAREYLREEHTRCRKRNGSCKVESQGGPCRSQRVERVGGFGRLCEALAKNEPLYSVTPLASPCRMPNYALQQNVRYVRIWEAYQKLLRQEDVLEQTWRWKRRTWADVLRLLAANAIAKLVTTSVHNATHKNVRIFAEPHFGNWLKPEPFDGPLVIRTANGKLASLYLLNHSDVDRVFQFGQPLSQLNADMCLVVALPDNPEVRVAPIWAMVGDARWEDPEKAVRLRGEWCAGVAAAVQAWTSAARRTRTTENEATVVRSIVVKADWLNVFNQTVTVARVDGPSGVALIETPGRREDMPGIVDVLHEVVRELVR